MTQNETVYTITLADPDGRLLSEVVSPVLPRHIHLVHEGETIVAELSDEAEPQDFRADSFDRIGSSVWIDDNRNALFVRRTG